MLLGAVIAMAFAATESASNAFAANELMTKIEIVPTKPLTTSLTSEALNNLTDTIANSIKTSKETILNKCENQASLYRAQVNLAHAWTIEPPEPSVLFDSMVDVRSKLALCKKNSKSIDETVHESIYSIRKPANQLEEEYVRVLKESIERPSANAQDVAQILLTEVKMAKENLTFYNVERQSLMMSVTFVSTSIKFLISMFEDEQSQAVRLFSANQWKNVAESKLAFLDQLCSLIEKTIPKLADVEVEAKVAEMRFRATETRLAVLSELADKAAARFKTAS